MKKIIFAILLISNFLIAQETDFVKNAETNNAIILQKGDAKDWCSVCGMNLKMFYKTNHAIELKDGTSKQYCSIHCLCTDKPNHKNQIKNIFVVDAKTEQMINVNDAFYVVGSDVLGTMSSVSKIAFSSKTDAEDFSKKFNGKNIMDFKSVSEMVEKKLSEETEMLMKRKEMKVYPKGEKLFNELCDKNIDIKNFSNIAELKAHLKSNNICKDVDEQKLQMIALYLWEVKAKEKSAKNESQNIVVPENAKCPVCGMFVYKYPKWAAVIETSKSKLYFDGVKDLMKFYFEPEKWSDIEKVKSEIISVTDYYLQTKIDGKFAVYVINSNVLGPMGNELIPFTDEKSAKEFVKDHGGKIISKFEEITKDLVYKLDE
ncbi:MAG: nitrous oxide reductase accessory protein NosL [Ignavibacteriae bacterium]|nr:nitrous oxide reductase accessory protein NosL [Ignavibacteriota bacterium]